MPSKKSKGKAKGKSKASNPLPAKPQMTKPPGSVPPPILPPLVTPTSNISSRHGSVSGSPIPPSTPPSRAVQSPRPPFLPPLLSTLAMDGPGSQRSSPTINPPPHTSHSNLDLRLMDLEKFTARYSSMPPPQLDPHDPDAQEANELINCARAKLQADITMQTGYGKTVFPGQEQAVRKGLDELMDMSRKHMENGGVQDNEVDEEGYWASFPPNIRNFAQAMYAIAQQMVQSSEEASGDAATQDNAGMKTQFPRHDLDLSHLEALAMSMPGGLDAVAVGVEGRGRGNNIVTTKATTFSGTTTTTTTTALGASTMPAFSLDVLSDPAFKQSLKDAAAALAPLPIPKERGGTYYVGREGYDDEEEVEGDDVDDEEEEYDDEDESLAQPPRAAKSTMADPPAPLSPTHRTASEQPEAGENKIGKKKRNKGKGRAESSEDQGDGNRRLRGRGGHPALTNKFSGCPSPAMPAGRNNIQQQDKQQQQQQLAQAVAQQPSSVSIGKKPMAYPPQQQGGQQPQPGQPGQQPQRSARAASKAPVTYSPQQQQPTQQHHHPSPPSSNASKGRGGGQKAASSTNPTPHQNNKIWSTSTTEERERIKDFWLGLGEEERRNLVKIEKDTVLRKMKEQQKHSCSCAVCGRKR
ncbi:hypothetical protein BDN72DRAFT_897515 [Pluteus cervinus]|uniref:Uncharacterized protein n=1 Tax=Pluteus cervinus TaxID=181527 RepID=A0ACD3AVZ5_9AGAR|nr:hypothetical protein BDN72DRAFT_897515 [Pluteus cervinus]